MQPTTNEDLPCLFKKLVSCCPKDALKAPDIDKCMDKTRDVFTQFNIRKESSYQINISPSLRTHIENSATSPKMCYDMRKELEALPRIDKLPFLQTQIVHNRLTYESALALASALPDEFTITGTHLGTLAYKAATDHLKDLKDHLITTLGQGGERTLIQSIAMMNQQGGESGHCNLTNKSMVLFDCYLQDLRHIKVTPYSLLITIFEKLEDAKKKRKGPFSSDINKEIVAYDQLQTHLQQSIQKAQEEAAKNAFLASLTPEQLKLFNQSGISSTK